MCHAYQIFMTTLDCLVSHWKKMAIVEKLFWQLGTHFLVTVTVVEMFDKNSQCMGCLPGQKSGCCREVVVQERSLLVEVQQYQAKVLPQRFYLNGNTILDCIHRMTKCLSITWSKSPYNGLYGESVPERGTFFRLQVYERVGISLVEVHKTLGKPVIWVHDRAQ